MTRLLVLPFLLTASVASASPMIDFSVGPTGPLGTSTTTIGGVKVDAFGGQLFRWRGEYCCEHFDAGLGILGPHEQINPAEPEINPGEWMRLTLPEGYRWLAIHFTSVNNHARGVIYEGVYPTGPGTYFSAADADANHFLKLGVSDPYAPYLWMGAVGSPIDNYWVTWGVDIKPGTPPAVPEPASLALLGTGLLGLVWRRRAA